MTGAYFLRPCLHMKPRERQPQPTPFVSAKPDARLSALELVSAVMRQRKPLDDVFNAAVDGLEPRDRAFARLLAATVLRRLGQIDAVLSQFLDREPPAKVHDALRLGAAQILFIGTPPHAAVATCVDLVKQIGQQRFSGLVNAVLRRVLEHGPNALGSQDVAQLNTPAWLWQRWLSAFGESTARAIAQAHALEAPIDLTLKDQTATTLWAEKLNAKVLPHGGLRLNDSGRIEQLPGFAEGAWWVQDAAAMLPAQILLHAMGDAKGKAVVDLCAAPGGKTLQLAAAGCDVTALDISAKRLALLSDNLQRTGLRANVVTADALTWRPAQPADAVLLDAPCSSTGTIRRHPDLPYLKRPDDFPRLAHRQRDMLQAAAAMLKPGGVLVYSVCALEPAEGEEVVDAVLAIDPSLTRQPIRIESIGNQSQFLTPRGDVRTLPCHWPELGGLDGFYAALLRKSAV